MLGNGDGTFGLYTLYPAGTTPQYVIAADFNGDDKLDLAVANEGSNTVSILLGNGDGTFQSHHDFPTGNGPGSLTTGDVNGNGRLDLAVPNGGDSTVSLLLGNGDGTFQTHVDYPVGSGPDYVAAGDFNNDGRLDVASANEIGNSVSVLLGVASPTVLLAPTSLRFPTLLVGTVSAPKTITLTNAGTAALAINSITASGDFSVTGKTCGSAVAVNASCTISITFNPTKQGVRTGAVTITDNAASSPQTASLTGAGTVVELVPARLNFCSEPVGTTSKAKQVTLTNTGAASLTIRSINPTGTDAGDFAVHKTTCAARASDSGCRSRLYDQCYVYSNGDGDKDCLSLRHRHWWG